MPKSQALDPRLSNMVLVLCICIQSQTYLQYRQQQYHARTGILRVPQAASSIANSLSMTQSMMEDGEGLSIK